MRELRRALVLGAGLWLAGCSSDGAGGAGGYPGSGGSGSGGAAGSGGTGGNVSTSSSEVLFDGTKFTARITAADIQPGGEDHVCVVVELPNTNPVWIDDMRATLSTGSHHLIVDRSPVGTAIQPVPTSCFPTMASDSSRLIIGQQADTRVTLPTGAAFTLAARQPIFLQLHYANLESVAEDITGTVELTIATGSTPPIEAKSLFTGSYSISIPPNGPGSSTHFYTPIPAFGTTRHVFALTSHTHKLGVRATIERVATSWDAPTTPIHESLSWSEPPLTQFEPTLDFSGTDGLRLTCYYQNTTNQMVGFGTGVDSEMCFMWVYYFDQ